MSSILCRLAARLHERRAALRANPEAGYSTETVVVTALLVLLAIAALAIITAKILAKARAIDLG